MKGSLQFQTIQTIVSIVLMVVGFNSFIFSQTFDDFTATKEIEEKIAITEKLATHYSKGDLDSLKIISYQLLVASNKVNSKSGIFHARKHLGNYYIRTSKWSEGLEVLRLTKNYFLEIEDYASVTEICNEIGNGYQYSGKVDTAIKWYKESLKYGKLSPDDNLKYIAKINLAQAYMLKKDYDKAIKTAFEYRDWVLSIGSADAVANAYAVLGKMALEQGKFNDAISYFEHSEKFALKSDSKSQQAHAYTNIGISKFYQGKEIESVEYFEKALAIHKIIKNVASICDGYLNVGGIYFELKDYDKAEQFYNDGYQFAVENTRYSSQLEFTNALIELKTLLNQDTAELLKQKSNIEELQQIFMSTPSEVDMALADELSKSETINGVKNSNSKWLFYSGVLIIFIVFITLVLRKKLV